eukprot:m51a1_g6027 putative calmodulin (141) ;mRNA; r:107438-108027
MVEMSGAELRELREVFARFDTDGDGHITTNDFGTALREHLHVEKSDRDLRAMVADHDADGDGTIDFVEFLALVKYMKKNRDEFAARKKGEEPARRKDALAEVVASLLQQWNIELEGPSQVLLPPAMQHLTTSELSSAFSS